MDDISKEIRMLKYKLDYLRRADPTPLPLEDQARVLQAECELREKSLGRRWFFSETEVENVIWTLEAMIQSDNVEKPHDFDAWMLDHFDNHDELRFQTLYLCFRCSEKSCIHYIYGLPTPELLEEHVKAHRTGGSSQAFHSSHADVIPQNEDPISHQDGSDEPAPDADFVYVSFDSGSAQKRKPQKHPSSRSSKRRKRSEMAKPDRHRNPCLRCKILKKECDDDMPCKQCPQQSLNEKGDYWKTLGCLRSLSDSIATTLFPVFSLDCIELADATCLNEDRSVLRRQILSQNMPLVTRSRDFFAFAGRLNCLQDHPSFKRFLSKVWNPQQILKDDGLMMWLPAVLALFKIQGINQNNAKATALDITIIYQSFTMTCDEMCELELVGLAVFLLEQTGSLLSQGTDSVDIGALTPKSVTQEGQVACMLCLLLSEVYSDGSNLRHQSESKNGKGKGLLEIADSDRHETMNKIVYRHLSWTLEGSLFEIFSENCCRRKCLTPELWFQIFTALCCYSIFKSILIDVQTCTAITDGGFRAGIAARIESAYKALVSVFIWATKSDLLVEWYLPAGREDSLNTAKELSKKSFDTLCQLVQRDQWENRGIKSSKDFLMGLGSGFYNDGTYNGFYIQRFGLKES